MHLAEQNVGDTARIQAVRVQPFTIPTDYPESDGTLEWDSTTLVYAEIDAGGKTGIGYTYADLATAELIRDTLAQVIRGEDALNTNACWWQMVRRIRNLGRPGISSMALSCLDVALWDLKSKLLDVPLVILLGGVIRDSVPIYGSGGFTSYSDTQMAKQFRGWVDQGISRVKMKIGRDPVADLHRVDFARSVIGPDVDLFVDANGAYTRKLALSQSEQFALEDVRWFEEPVSSDDLEGLKLLRFRMPPEIEVAAGEYGYDAGYFRRMLEAGAVDVLQADATRCGGYTGFLQAADLCVAFDSPLSAHCAPQLHTHIGCSAQKVRHLEYFHDHVRIENKLFDGVPQPTSGRLSPDLSRLGLGIELKRADAERYAA
jgi:L-alanine-DL-glutamate epimerase-like enolase superfamily enzyme